LALVDVGNDAIVATTPAAKRSRTFATPIVDESDSDSDGDDDDDEEARVLFYRGGIEAKIREKLLVTRLKEAFLRGGVRSLPTPNNVPTSVDTVYCVYEDHSENRAAATAELLNDAQLMRLCMDGRLRMTPLSTIVALVIETDGGPLTLDMLRRCAYERRENLIKFKSSVETFPLVPPQWRIPSGSIEFPLGTPVVRTRDELYAYLKQQMFPCV
jgi:hypothetical protein